MRAIRQLIQPMSDGRTGPHGDTVLPNSSPLVRSFPAGSATAYPEYRAEFPGAVQPGNMGTLTVNPTPMWPSDYDDPR